LLPQRSDNGRLGNPPCDQLPHFTPQVLQGGPSNGKPTALNSSASIEDARVKLSYDLYYVKYRSVLLDLIILFSTIRVILFQEGSR